MNPRSSLQLLLLAMATLALTSLTGCATAEQSLRELAALQDVDVDVAGTRNELLAGISVSRLRNPDQLRAQDVLRLAAAIRQRNLPLQLTLDLDAENTGASRTARILSIDWRLLVQDREAVGGRIGAQPAIAPGRSIRIPIDLELELVQLFGDDLEELVRVARLLAGDDAAGDVDAFLMVTPTVETALGPLRSPRELRIPLR